MTEPAKDEAELMGLHYQGPVMHPIEADALRAENARLRKENDRLRNHHKKIWTESYHAMLAGEVKP